MNGLEGPWGLLASVQASITVGLIGLAALFWVTRHQESKYATRTTRAAALFALCASFYTLTVLVFSQLVFNGPSVSTLVSDGFGDERVAWLMMAVIVDQVFRIVNKYDM